MRSTVPLRLIARVLSNWAMSMYLTVSCVTFGGCLGRLRAAVPMPAEQIVPANGFEVDSRIHFKVFWTAFWREAEEETSVLVKRIREESKRDVASEGGGLRSRMETLAPFCTSVMTVARPSPLEPPDTMKVRSLICMIGMGREGYQLIEVEGEIGKGILDCRNTEDST